jgi:hypothetical protein
VKQLKEIVQFGGTEQIEPQADVLVRLFQATEDAPVLVGQAPPRPPGGNKPLIIAIRTFFVGNFSTGQ